MLGIPRFWYLLIHRRWLHLIRRAAGWRREAVWKQLSFFIKIFKILKKKKKGFQSQGQSTTSECCYWARVHSGICLFSPRGKLYSLLSMGVGYCSSMSYHVLPSTSDFKYRFIFYIFFPSGIKPQHILNTAYIQSTLHLKQFKRKNIPLKITSIMLLAFAT